MGECELYFLDTNAVSAFLLGRDAALVASVDKAMSRLLLSSVVWGELWYGMLKRPDRPRLRSGLVRLRERIVDVEPFDERASEVAAEVRTYLATLRLNGGSHITGVYSIHLYEDGTFFLDDWGTHDSENGGVSNNNRVSDDTIISLFGGTLTYRRGLNKLGADITPEKIGEIALGNAAPQNSIALFAKSGIPELRATQLSRGDFLTTRNTLHFSEAQSRLWLDTSTSGYNVTNAGGEASSLGRRRWRQRVEARSSMALPKPSPKSASTTSSHWKATTRGRRTRGRMQGITCG